MIRMFYILLKKIKNYVIFFSVLFLIVLVRFIIVSGEQLSDSNFLFVGLFGEKGNQEGRFENPAGISVDVNGLIYVADAGNHRIQKFSSRGDFIEYRGGFGWSGESFDKPFDIYAKSVLDIFVIDQNVNRIIRFDKDLNYISSLEAKEVENDNLMFGFPSGITVSKRGDIFIVDGENKRIIKINSFGKPEMSFGGFENLNFRLKEPFQIAVSPENNIFVSDFELAKIFVFDYFGNFLYEISNKYMKSSAGIDIDDNGRLFVADLKGSSIYVFNFKGDFLFEIKGNQIGGGEIIEEPIDIAFYKGLLYVADKAQNRIYILKEKN